MSEAAEAMEFERAAALRDRIKALTQVQTAQGINPRGVAEADVIALHLDGGQACVQVFFIRANQNWGNHDYYPRLGSEDVDPSEIMQAFVGQFYSDREPPRLVLLSHGLDDVDLMAEALAGKAGRKVEISVPQRGEKAELVSGAARNARESLARGCRNRRRRPSCCAALPRRWTCPRRRAGSRSTTTRTSWARTRSAA